MSNLNSSLQTAITTNKISFTESVPTAQVTSTSISTVTSKQITIPGPGVVLVIATARIVQLGAGETWVVGAVEKTPSALSTANSSGLKLSGSEHSSIFSLTYCEAVSAAEYTYYFNFKKDDSSNADFQVMNTRMVVLFIKQ